MVRDDRERATRCQRYYLRPIARPCRPSRNLRGGCAGACRTDRSAWLTQEAVANMTTSGAAKSFTPGYNQRIPDEIMTPDSVPTRLGTLTFVDGVPTAETAALAYDNLDFLRGVEVFLNFIPATSMEALRRGNVERGATHSHQVVIFDELLDSNPLLLTGNTDTVYCSVFLDLEAGPTVVEIPPGCGPGTVNDAFFRFVIDMGGPGPDAGKGGKYLIVPDGFTGDVPKDVKDGGEYFVARSPSYVQWLILRGFLVDGKPDAASKMFREGLKVYPLSQAKSQPKMEFINSSKVPFNTIHANTFAFYPELDHVIQKEPLEFIDPELRGLAASIGIRKGQPFAPDARMKKTLTEAVAVGNATARAMTFHNRDSRAYLSTRTASGRPVSSAATTSGWTATACRAAISTRARCSSTPRPSTRRR